MSKVTHEHTGHDHMSHNLNKPNSFNTHDKHAGHSPKIFKNKFWLSFILTIPTLIFSNTVQGWFGLKFGFIGSEYIPAIFGIIVFIYGGYVFIKGALAELLNRQPGMMTLISMAIIVAFGYSLASTFKIVDGMDFWWELSTLTTIVLLGHWLEMVSIQNAEGALDELAKLIPDEAELVTGENIKKISVNELKVNDLFLVRPGAKIAADGIIIKGESDINESMLTGESKPVKKTINMTVIAGTINGSGSITAKVTKIGDDTTLAGIMKLVADAQNSKSKTQILADKAAFWLTIAALIAALATWIGWAIAGAPAGFILERVVTVLVIACPHALGLAVPLVTSISTTMAAKNGLLIRHRIALEAARNIDVVIFDKTGTLTEGRQGVVDIISTIDRNNLLAIAATIELNSEHPIAQAIVASAKNSKISINQPVNFVSLAGRGAKAIVDSNETYIGNLRLIDELQAIIPENISQAAEQASKDGKTVVYVIRDKQVIGVIMLTDIIRSESKEAVTSLHKKGKRVAMLTGDSKDVAAWVADELGITEYFAEVLPEDKTNTIKKLQADGSRVAMVGDGVNDAPALTQADIGIAIGAGTDVAIESADIVLASSDPRSVAKIIKLSDASYRKMSQNLAWATGYNAIAIPLAAGITSSFGFVLSPAYGAVLMSISTIIVAINAQLLRRVKL